MSMRISNKLRIFLISICCVGLVDGVALAQKKKRKKKKKATASETMQGEAPMQGEVSTESMGGGGDHGAQEKPGLYKHDLSMGLNFLMSSSTITPEGGEDADGPSMMNFGIDAKYHYILGQMGPGSLGVGPVVLFSMTSTEVEAAEFESSKTTMGIGASVIYWFLGDVQRDIMVPFAEVDAVYISQSESNTTAGTETEEPGTSGFEIDVAAGVYYFLTDGVAIKAAGLFQMRMLSTEEAEGGTPAAYDTSEMNFGIKIGLSSLF